MTLETLLNSMHVFGPIALVKDWDLCCGMPAQVYYGDTSSIGEVDPQYMKLEVTGINARCGDEPFHEDWPSLEIALDWEGMED